MTIKKKEKVSPVPIKGSKVVGKEGGGEGSKTRDWKAKG